MRNNTKVEIRGFHVEFLERQAKEQEFNWAENGLTFLEAGMRNN